MVGLWFALRLTVFVATDFKIANMRGTNPESITRHGVTCTGRSQAVIFDINYSTNMLFAIFDKSRRYNQSSANSFEIATCFFQLEPVFAPCMSAAGHGDSDMPIVNVWFHRYFSRLLSVFKTIHIWEKECRAFEKSARHAPHS